MNDRKIEPKLVERVSRLIADADHILIGAGAGLSTDAGFDFGESEQFQRRYPYLRPLGILTPGHSIGFPWPSKSIKWAFYARFVEEILHTPPPNPEPYLQLERITRHADRWVVTSNADNLFVRLGFDPERVWTRQGTFAHLQCLRPCCEEVWDSAPYVERLLEKVDLVAGDLTDDSVIPRCPRCGGEMMLYVREGAWFAEKPLEKQQEAFLEWLEQTRTGRLVVIEIGAGFSTPIVIRWPCESIAAHHPNAQLIRINPEHPQTRHPMNGRITCVEARAARVLSLLSTSGEPS